MYNIHLLPAEFGDSILVEFGSDKKKYIWIDGGPFHGYPELIKSFQKVMGDHKVIDLLVITHIDIDHIDGIIRFLNRDELDVEIKEVWFNGYDVIRDLKTPIVLGVLQGEYLSFLLNKHGIRVNTSFEGKAVMTQDESPVVINHASGMKLTIMSPHYNGLLKLKQEWEKFIADIKNNIDIEERLKEDKRYDDVIILGPEDSMEDLMNKSVNADVSVPNASSIAFIAEYDNNKVLFAGDANSSSLIKSINALVGNTDGKLKLDVWKLAHHGSKGSNLESLMKRIDCKQMLISSNGMRYKHPDEECIAKLIKNCGPNLNFYFNYHTKFNERWAGKDLQMKYQFQSHFPVNENGIKLKLTN